MSSSRIIRLILMLLLFLGIVAYIIYIITRKPQGYTQEVCNGIVLTIAEDPRANFISEKTIEEILSKVKINPVGRLMKDINLQEIEKTIRLNQYVDSVECYKTANGKVCVRVSQRTPVIYVIPDSASSGYYVDSQGNIIPNTSYAADILVATGDITRDYAKTRLVEFGKFLLDDSFWDNQIEQLHVTKSRGHDPFVELVPRVGEQTIYLGTIDDFQKKLRRLKVFYTKAMPLIGWNKYSRINLEYPNQVICTKRPIAPPPPPPETGLQPE